MKAEMMLTYQTRFELSSGSNAILQHCANLLSSVERSLFAEVARGKTAASCKNQFLKKFDIDRIYIYIYIILTFYYNKSLFL